MLVPNAAPATVPIASETIACFARGNLLSRMNPACSHTPINVPMASNVSMNRKTKTNGNIVALSACTTSMCKNVGPSDGGAATTDLANSKRVMSIELVTSREAEMTEGNCGSAILPTHVRTVATTMPQRIEPRTRRECNTAIVNKPMKNTIRSGDEKCVFNFPAVPGSLIITPACCSPMNAMNRPIPAATRFSYSG